MILETAQQMKRRPEQYSNAMMGRCMALFFEKPSLRTRVSFELGFAKLGGRAIYLDQQGVRMGERESVSDCAKNLERWTDVIVARTYLHETICELAQAADVPVINALSDQFHPCQALADVLTLAEQFGDHHWPDVGLAYIGEGNNVCHSLMLIAATIGMRLTIITPAGSEPAPHVTMVARELAKHSEATINVTNDLDAVRQHDVVYTDTWTSMGSEAVDDDCLKAFEAYQINARVMALAGEQSVFMHCLPAKRGREVTAEVIDSPRSIVFDQAENRMHAQNALLVHLLSPGQKPDISIRPTATHASTVPSESH
jgi:ornithine carbamoyltransferase